ncbi:hypothetical protein F7Q99_08840 [Streptomyces kaniharaensis]|uniref:Peptidase inhibitor family I36 protein n=1 Tax=Streptomyces kaniharaensis TaxID=212423 RepID=A0A6N7KLI8_9ACTN|nr:hypothetical protein [Streptomyces kaniharaensis]MQS12390.1 hypothetical protein [Streptomyces kaniharaensis]
MRTLAASAAFAALLGAPLAFGPVAQAAAAPADGCAKGNVCLYSAKNARGTIVWQAPLSQIQGSDITNVKPTVQAASVRTPLPAGGDCSVGLFPGSGLGGDAKWANGRATNLTDPGSNAPIAVASMYVDCG